MKLKKITIITGLALYLTGFSIIIFKEGWINALALFLILWALRIEGANID